MLNKLDVESLSYDDILLLPQSSDIESRDDINLFNSDGYIPIFSSPMVNISEPDVVIEMGRLGGIGILHRFFKYDEERYDAIRYINKEVIRFGINIKFGISIGINDFTEELKVVDFATKENRCDFIVIDTASGYLQKTLHAVQLLNNWRGITNTSFKIIAGNVVDFNGCYELARAGADIIRINIGSGLQCLTSKSIGIGCPPLTAIRQSSDIKRLYPNIMLLADGGIYTPGDGLKALAFGADGLMIGSLFGRAIEAKNNGIIYGMSSYKLQDRMNKQRKSNEGTVTIIPKEEMRPLKNIFDEFIYGLKSGMVYLNIKDIVDMHNSHIEYITI